MIDFADDDRVDPDAYPTVVRIPARCPQCGLNRARVTGQSRSGMVRYHRCLSCGTRFKSIEIEPPPETAARN